MTYADEKLLNKEKKEKMWPTREKRDPLWAPRSDRALRAADRGIDFATIFFSHNKSESTI
jgi:hypothetical protein